VKIESTEIHDVKTVVPVRHGDPRGFFSESFKESALREAGVDVRFTQDNESLSTVLHTVRGLHFQAPPFAQAKLIRVVLGSILDVAVDLRRSSPTYGQHVAYVLDDVEGRQLFIPEGFAHGFITLTPEARVCYKVNAPYSPRHDGGVAWDDPDIGIGWPADVGPVLLSDKDRRLPRLSELGEVFA
jgi:dTDP-4-dehydrorhamnose 3,5-epimerase